MGAGGAVGVSVQRTERGALRGLRVRALGCSERGILTLRGLRGSTGEEALAVWLRSEGTEGGTRRRKSERLLSREMRGGWKRTSLRKLRVGDVKELRVFRLEGTCAYDCIRERLHVRAQRVFSVRLGKTHVYFGGQRWTERWRIVLTADIRAGIWGSQDGE